MEHLDHGQPLDANVPSGSVFDPVELWDDPLPASPANRAWTCTVPVCRTSTGPVQKDTADKFRIMKQKREADYVAYSSSASTTASTVAAALPHDESLLPGDA